ncbi:transcriptional regulator, TetR family [Bhargavaea ginsengi]|uniref:Transcriptional regulator, TetR family n=1 Tax=Bhargavaea ginsengi TaxID=426757 RepID=A0A1H6TGU7_9BACL|nr:TetR/AcrR family transcriptional regulator [Bhargavaea ginsengi]SEI77394.1 transcriptional regulator, TetR family [Bhargavaea ginsengi]
MNERKRHVLDAARRLFLDNGFADTSIQNILDEAGISKGTFYNYFSSKNECLISIIEESRETSTILRDELAADRRDGPELLIDQLLVRLRMNREQQLIRLYEAILHSGDAELRKFMKTVHLAELAWLERRLTEVFGEWAEPYSADAALMHFGMLGQYLQFAPDVTSSDELTKRIRFVIRRTEALLRDMAEHREHLLEADQFNERAGAPPLPSASQTAREIRRLAAYLSPADREAGREYADFLSAELEAERPRTSLVRTIAGPFRKLFDGTPLEPEVRTVMSAVWQLLGTADGKPGKED